MISDDSGSNMLQWYNKNMKKYPLSSSSSSSKRSERQSSSSIAKVVDELFLSLPVDLNPLVDIIEEDPELLLTGRCLERLITAVLNEEDDRIADFHSKYQVIAILANLASLNRRSRLFLRRLLEATKVWADEVVVPANLSCAWNESLQREMIALILTCWRIPSDIANALHQSNSLSIRDTLKIILQHYGAVQVQSIIRAFLARLHLRQRLQRAAEEQRREVQQWSILLIQKVARGYIARKTLVRSMAIRKQLSKEILRIAERFLVQGDLWGFLKEVNDELQRSQRELQESEAREDDWAANFVQRVITQRKAEFDDAWDRFPLALSEAVSKNKESKSRRQQTAVGSLIDGHVIVDPLTSSSANNQSSNLINKQQQSSSLSDPSSLVQATTMNTDKRQKSKNKHEISVQEVEQAMIATSQQDSHHLPFNSRRLPGPLMRKALQTTVKVEVAAQLNKIVNTSFHTRKLAMEMRMVYGPEADTHKNKNKKRYSHHNHTGKGKKKNKTTLDGKEIVPVGQVQASHSVDWLSQASFSSSTGHDYNNNSNGNSKQQRIAVPVPVQPGHSLLLDVPLGLEDSIERLLHAAALRCYVPAFFRGPSSSFSVDDDDDSIMIGDTMDDDQLQLYRKQQQQHRKQHQTAGIDPEAAYKLYLALPLGLAKIKYESECKQWSQVIINRLRVKGLSHLRDVLPVSKFAVCLKNVDCPRSLLNKAIDLVLDLKNMGTILIGSCSSVKAAVPAVKELASKKKEEPKQQQSLPLRGQQSAISSIRAVKSAGDGNAAAVQKHVYIADETADKEHEQQLQLRPLTASDEKIATVAEVDFEQYGSNMDGAMLSLQAKTIAMSQTADDNKAVNDLMDRAGQLLQSMVEDREADWCKLTASIDDLFIQAAFLIVPHPNPVHVENVPAVEEMGNHAFKAYAMDLLQIEETDEGGEDGDTHTQQRREDFVRARFRSAVILTTPFTLYLKNHQVSTVQDLLTVDLKDLDMPSALLLQLEVLITAVVSQRVHARLMPIPRNHRKAMSAEDFAVPMFYDTRFQRTPFDPMGRPPVALDKTAAKQQLKRKDHELSLQRQSVDTLDRVTSKQAVSAQLEQPISLWEQMSLIDQEGEGNANTATSITLPSSSSMIGAVKGPISSSNSNTWQFTLQHDKHSSHHYNSSKEKLALTLPPINNTIPSHNSNRKNNKKREKREQEIQDETIKPDFIHRNMMIRPLDAFKETHRCHFPGCGEVFSRLYTFKVHLKTHEMFPGYYSYKQRPQIYNDDQI